MKYSDFLADYLVAQGYTHCYFVAGGNIMHLLDSARSRFVCVPVIHEVAAGIAVEYFNESNLEGKKAFALVTAGPGLTNIVTAIAGAYLESRELLVIGGQVKTADLKSTGMRQRGIQEIDGVELVSSITSRSVRLSEPVSRTNLQKIIKIDGRPGPVFVEIPLDVQAMETVLVEPENESSAKFEAVEDKADLMIADLVRQLQVSMRPIILFGGGLSRKTVREKIPEITSLGVPIMTTWNGADRYGSDLPNYWGRPNTWGQRSSNILIQQSDLLIVIGSRLGLQQTGFAWDEFAPLAKIFQIDIDELELTKGHPLIHSGIKMDADAFLNDFLASASKVQLNIESWLNFGSFILDELPLSESANETAPEFVNPYSFVLELSRALSSNDVIIPCSSGGAFTVTMQALQQKFGQIIISDKGLASMGYGLSGAIGAAQSTNSRVILIEGDGGFSQNMQELGTVARQNLNVKIFIFENSGYASIRMTQKNYFGGSYLGCDVETGLGLPNWELIANAYGIRHSRLESLEDMPVMLEDVLNSQAPEFVVVAIDPNQTYYPKISSRVTAEGSMASNPLHLMTPDLTEADIIKYLPFLRDRILK